MTDEIKKQEDEAPNPTPSAEAAEPEAQQAETPESALRAAVGGAHTNPLHK